MDRERGMFVDPAKVRKIDFKGRFFSSRGPLNTARPPQGHPVLVQAGNSPQGQDFAAKHMDAVLCAVSTVEEMKAFRLRLRKKVAAAGRDPDSCKVMFRGHARRSARATTRPGSACVAGRPTATAAPELALAQMGSLTDIDFSVFDIDAPLGELTTNGQQGTLKRFLKQGATLREIAQNYRYSYEDLVGTPDTVAGQMAELMEEVGGDGFVFTGNLTRRYIAEITDGLVPALQRRGVVRDRLRARALPRQPSGLLMPPLGKMILRRLLWVFPVAFGVVTMTFFMARVLNGDPTELYAPPEATDALRAEIRARLGLADPLPHAVHPLSLANCCASTSAFPSRPARASPSDLWDRLPATLELGLRRAGARHRRRHPARRAGRRPSRALAGLPGARHDLERHGAAAILGRAGADQHLLRRPALAAGAGRAAADRHRPAAQGHRLPADRHAARRQARSVVAGGASSSPCRR